MNNALGCNLATIGLGIGVFGLFSPPGEGAVIAGIGTYGGAFTVAVHYAVSC